MNIITGYRDEPHVTSQQERDGNIALYGDGTFILDVGSKMAATIISANEVQIADGLIVAQGCTAEIERGTSESIAVDNGEQGMMRKDLIILRYTRNASTNVEDMELDIVKGTPSSSNPAVPSYTSGSIADGDTLVEIPIYTININGITIQSVTAMVELVQIPSKSFVESMRASLTSAINAVSSTLTTVSNRVGTATLNTTAKNALGAINELLVKINANTSNVADARSRASALETKTAGIVRTSSYSVSAGANDYKQLSGLATYILVVNGASMSNTVRGLYLIGSTTSSALGIKAINAASDVVVADGGNGLLKITNNGSVTLRVTLITTFD